MPSAQMTPAEFAAARQRLRWSQVDAAVEYNVTPNVIEGFESGAVTIPKRIARDIRLQSVLRERQDVIAASGLPECAEEAERERALIGKAGDDSTAASEALIAHLKSCALCRERREYLERHGPPLLELPTPTFLRVFGWLYGLQARLPRPIRPPEGDAGDGRRIGVFMGAALSAFACAAVLLSAVDYVVHRGSASRSWRDIVPLGGIIVGYFVGFYLAGWAWDALRPIRKRLIGYVLRFGLAGAAIYGTIAAIMPFIDEKPMSLMESLAFVGIVSGIWALIGVGLWVRDRWRGKLAKT